jgi:hypothetical protein
MLRHAASSLGALTVLLIGTGAIGGLPEWEDAADAAAPRVIVYVDPVNVPGTPYTFEHPNVSGPEFVVMGVDPDADGSWLAILDTTAWPGLDAAGELTAGPALPGTYEVTARCILSSGGLDYGGLPFEIVTGAPATRHARSTSMTIEPAAGPVGTALEVRGTDCPGSRRTRIGYNVTLLDPPVIPGEPSYHPILAGGWRDVDPDGTWLVDLDTSTWPGFDDEGFETLPPPLAGHYEVLVGCYAVDASGLHPLFSYPFVGFDLVEPAPLESRTALAAPHAIPRPDDATMSVSPAVLDVGAVAEMSGRGCIAPQVVPTTTTTATTTASTTVPVAPPQAQPAAFAG